MTQADAGSEHARGNVRQFAMVGPGGGFGEEVKSSLPMGIGLGCSRFGSIVNGVTEQGAERLIAAAIECGILHFDTADIYGQGDSERMLGKHLRPHRARIFLATKVGQYFSLPYRFLRPLKAPLAAIITSVAGAKDQLQQTRERSLPRCYDSRYLQKAVAGSLRRLRMEYVDLVYLHSPAIDDLVDGSAVGTLDQLRGQGLLRLVGVSCDDLETARQALRDPRVTVLQVPYLPRDDGWADFLTDCGHRGVSVVVRSVFGGSGPELDETARCGIIAAVTADAAIRSALVGTSNDRHLRQVASWSKAEA